jgi:hypothetical protein
MRSVAAGEWMFRRCSAFWVSSPGGRPQSLPHISTSFASTAQHASCPAAEVEEYTTKAGGSAANTTKGARLGDWKLRTACMCPQQLTKHMGANAGLAAGFGVKCRLVGARGQDEQGAIFASSLKRSGVDVSRLRVGKGSTGAVRLCHHARLSHIMEPWYCWKIGALCCTRRPLRDSELQRAADDAHMPGGCRAPVCC